jgi:hypothetical protein
VDRPDPRELLDRLDAGQDVPAAEVAAAVRALAKAFAAAHPGRTVELRIPPYVAVQAIAGPVHKRGTPPNVVQTDPLTWLRLALGTVSFGTAVASGLVQAAGPRSDLSAQLPVLS